MPDTGAAEATPLRTRRTVAGALAAAAAVIAVLVVALTREAVAGTRRGARESCRQCR